ncbi:hypothetical protein C8R41DRAFT_869708 [Lentinula lateritia]|uniref:Uncharacterized protein n=1 Tax=Lentinula lateritia TaxID=40482 RepID=A0ABQ8V6F7_9AGAR|nr:hypothetical protein C8R41DRAFT_869708 [Lentinula lateritia]
MHLHLSSLSFKVYFILIFKIFAYVAAVPVSSGSIFQGAGVAGPSNSRGSESPSGSRTKVEVNFNPESVELDRSKPAEVVTASPWAFLPDDEKKEWSDGIKKVIARGLPRVEFELAKQELSVDSLSGFPSPERDGTIHFAIPASSTRGSITLGKGLLFNYVTSRHQSITKDLVQTDPSLKTVLQTLLTIRTKAVSLKKDVLMAKSKS